MDQRQNFVKAVKAYLSKYQYNYCDYSFDQEHNQITWMNVPSNSAIGDYYITFLCMKSGLLCRAHCMHKAQPYQYPKIVEYITRASARDPWAGNFEFDYEDGEILWKKHLPCSSQEPNYYDVERTINNVMSMFSKYGDGLAALLSDNSDP